MRIAFITVVFSLLSTISFAQSDDLLGEIEEHHFAYVPDGDGRFRTLIIAPGCSGIASEDQDWEKSNPKLRQGDLLFRGHYRKVAEAYKLEGYATFFASEVGVHTLTARQEGVDVATITLAANLSNIAESDVEPSAELLLGGKKLEAPVPGTATYQQSIWLYLVLMVLLLLMVEWYTFNRRITV